MKTFGRFLTEFFEEKKEDSKNLFLTVYKGSQGRTKDNTR